MSSTKREKRSGPASTPRTPAISPASAITTCFASASAPVTSTSAFSGTSGSSSTSAERLWNAPITRTLSSFRISAASSVAEPAGTSTGRGPRSKTIGTTASTRILPAICARRPSRVARCAEYGTTTTMMSASAAAVSLPAPSTFVRPRVAASSVPAATPRSASRLPMITRCPASAKRVARPRPSGPVPPMSAIVWGMCVSRVRRAPLGLPRQAGPRMRVFEQASARLDARREPRAAMVSVCIDIA